MDRESFFKKPEKPKTEDVELSDGRKVQIKKLSQAEVEYSRKHYSSDDKALEGMRYLVCKCVVDANGKRVFEDEDQARMTTVDFDDIQTIATAVIEFSGLNKNAKKA